MRLVFTKLETPKKNILVDLGTGTFEEFSLQELEDSETGKYLQIPDTIPTNSIRVKVSSSEFGSFDMIKEYQITDDEGNVLGGNVGSSEIEIEDINFYISEVSQGYTLCLDGNEAKIHIHFIFNGLCNKLCYRVLDQYYHMQDLVPYEIAYQAEGSLLYLVTYGVEADSFYTPLPYRIKIVEHLTENPDFEEPMPEQPLEQN